LFGLDPIEKGEILIDGAPALPGPMGRIRQRMAFLTEDRREEGLMMEAGIAENVLLASLRAFSSRGSGLLNRAGMNREVARITGAVQVKGASQRMVKTLSGGNQQKVVLAKWLLGAPAVFLLDEPTRGVDVGAKTEIYRLIVELAAQGAGVLLISSEIEELIGLSDRILVLSGGAITDCIDRPEFDRERILRSALFTTKG
jgi:ribose transport system ATP-binding protein